jgi:hypothetical protein
MSCARGHYERPVCPFCVDVEEHLERLRDQGIMTVGELRRMLVGLDELTQVVIGSVDGEYLNIEGAILPDGEDWHAVTLFTANTYDSRQF